MDSRAHTSSGTVFLAYVSGVEPAPIRLDPRFAVPDSYCVQWDGVVPPSADGALSALHSLIGVPDAGAKDLRHRTMAVRYQLGSFPIAN